MSSPDDVAYRKSVRNMAAVLAAIFITIFAAIFVPPYVHPYRDVFQPAVSLDSPFGFTIHMTENATALPAGGHLLITGWVNSTASSIENITAAQSWAVPQSRLWGQLCTSGWPIGVGIMKGHYTEDNYTLGSLIPFPQPLGLVSLCPTLQPPHYYLLEPHSSKALVTIGGTPRLWVIQTSLLAGPTELAPGVYTAVLADEWGDLLTANFRVT